MSQFASSASPLTRRSLLAAAAHALVTPAASWAQSDAAYPKAGSVLRYIVPFTPGGLTDVMARLVGQHLGERMNLNVLIDNKPGAGAMLGAEAAVRSAADGYNILAVNMTHSVNATLFQGRAKFDLSKDLKPVAFLAGSPVLVVVPANSSIHSLEDLVKGAKQKPLNAGSSGLGTPSHLSLALFNQLNGTSIQHIPYKGGSPLLSDLMAGQLDVIFSNFPESIPFVKAGKLRAIAIATDQRNAQVPEVPTTAEAGMPKLNVEQWTAVMVPAATPDAVVNTLSQELVQIMQIPEVVARSTELGFRVDPKGPAEFTQFWNAEVQRWSEVIQAAGITAD